MALRAAIYKWWYRADRFGNWEDDGVLILPVTHKRAVVGLLNTDKTSADTPAKEYGLLHRDLAGRVLIQINPPENPRHGMEWWDPDSGMKRIYYSDATVPDETGHWPGVWVDGVPIKIATTAEKIRNQNDAVSLKLWSGTQAELDAIDAETPNPLDPTMPYGRDMNTLYFVEEDE